MEIGSIYEIDPKSAVLQGKETETALHLGETEKYNKENICLTASGREAIALALKSLENNHPRISKRCLLPAYMCDTVFFPFERAGWEIHFYHLNRQLEADVESLRKQIENIRPGLLFIHPYYGADTWKPMRSLLRTWRKQGICIMEDVTQSYYLEDVGKEADYVVGSLRKWYAIPDGGFVATDEVLTDAGLPANEYFTTKRMELLTQKWEYLYGEGSTEEKKALKTEFLGKNRKMEEWLDECTGIGALSEVAAAILSRTDEQEAKRKREANYEFLYKRLVGKTQFEPILTQGEAPLYFAIYAKDREDLQKYLVGEDVYAPVLWPVGKANESCLTPDERYIYEHMLALPMDQRYGVEQMQRVVEVLEQYEEAKTGEQSAERQCTAMQQEEVAFNGKEPELIGIRVDANETIAMGHVMRCITIAGQLEKMGIRVLFLTADEYPAELLKQAGMNYECLHTDWNRMEEEIPKLREVLERTGCRKLLVDSYQATEKYFDRLGDICKIIYIDDCFEGVWPVDMLINYNAYHVRFPYRETYEQTIKNPRLLLGTSYVPLREEFQKETDAPEDEVHVLLSSGGGDVYNALTGIIREVVKEEAFKNVIFHTVVGRFNQNGKELETLAEQYANIRLHHNVSNMAELMADCRAAVSAAGTVLFELSAMQVPTVFFVCADNQQYDSEFFDRDERMLFAGDIRMEREKCLADIRKYLKQILEDEQLQARMRKALRAVTDGRGAVRIAEEIRDL